MRYYLKLLMVFLLLSAGLFSLSSFGATHHNPLPPDQAFKFSATYKKNGEALLTWQIARGYYLYKQKTQVSIDPVISKIIYPQGVFKSDELRGRFEAYTNTLNIPVKLGNYRKQVEVSVDYQGCSEAGFCYPPIHKELFIDNINKTISAADKTGTLETLASDQNSVRDLLVNQSFFIVLCIFFGLGLLLALTPCVLPMIPILTGIIVGQKEKLSTKKAFSLSLTYVLGSSITYAIAGVIAALMGSSLQVWLQQPWILAATSGLFALLALSLFGFYDLNLPRTFQYHITALSRKQQSGTFVGVFIMGIVSTLIVSPCVTAPLVGVLMYIGQSGDTILGASALFAMGMGMGIPLLLIGTSAGKLLPRSGPWMEIVKKFFGLLMLMMAIWIFLRIPNTTIRFEALGIGFILLALFIAFYLPKLIGFRKVNLTVSVFIALVGTLIITNHQSTKYINPWLNSGAIAANTSFIVVHDVDTLNHHLASAHAAHKPVLLDFYAEWCESCVVMDKRVFNTTSVKQALRHFVLLRADLTSNDKDQDALLKNFAVIAPPTVIFFNNSGKEVTTRRIVGEVNAQEFIHRINTFMSASCDKKLQC